MTSSFLMLMMLLARSIAHRDNTSTSTVNCHFSPIDGVRHYEGERGTVNLTCINRMFSLGRTIVIITLDPTTDGDTLSLCVQDSNICKMSNKPIMLNMTSKEFTYTLQVTAKTFGIRCLRETSAYQRGSMIFPSSMSEESLQLMYNMSGNRVISLDEPLQMDIPDEYTEVFVIKQEPSNKVKEKVQSAPLNPEERMMTAEKILFADLTKDAKELHFEMLNDSRIGNWQQYAVYTAEDNSDEDDKGSMFSKILTMLALCVANFMIGTGIDYQVIKNLGEEVMSSYRQCNCFSRLISLRAWKVGLFCQVFYPSILSFALGKLIFTDNSMQCNVVMDLSRLGLFLLGTAPGNTGATYFSALWNGDLNLSVALVILSTVISPLTTVLWWATLGKILLNSTKTDILTVPILFILEFLVALVVPIFIGIGLAGKFPSVKQFMEQIRKPFIVVGVLCCIIIYYYQYRNFLNIFSTSHVLACAALALGSAFLAGITAYFCHLNTSQIISIVIDCTMQNGTLSYAVINSSMQDPETQYAASPANAQILFTSAPIMLAWILYFGGKKVKSYVTSKSVTDPVQVASVQSQENAVGGEDEGFQMVQISKIKEAWADQEVLRHLWV